jgi:hypothetical protein
MMQRSVSNYSSSILYVHTMNGVEKKQLQLDRGTRGVVECLDEVRIAFGFDQINVLTPIVETKLRAGFIPARPLKFSYKSPQGTYAIEFTIPVDYPKNLLTYNVDCFGSSNAESFLPECAAISPEENSPKSIIEKVSFLATQISNGIDRYESESDTVNERFETIEDDEELREDNHEFYCCRRCRYCLSDSTLLHEHSKLKGNSANCSCTSLFMENPPVFLDMVDDSGKLLCPKCSSRVGQWSWVGIPCSCGEWVIPAFQITKSKIDVKSLL